MKIILLIIITTLLSLGLCHAQKINDSGYRTVGTSQLMAQYRMVEVTVSSLANNFSRKDVRQTTSYL